MEDLRMEDYTKVLPEHRERYVGENDLFLEIYEGKGFHNSSANERRPPILFVHGAYTGSWMWSKYIPHFVEAGYRCYAMNMRSHYRSRSMDLTRITYEDYLEDMKEMMKECGEPPVVIGFSMGGLLSQKLAEEVTLNGLVVIDAPISKEVNEIVPYENLVEDTLGIVVPAPVREEDSMDESPEDIAFQKKYLSMESSKALKAMASWMKGNKGLSINENLITCPCLVIKSVNSANEDRIGAATAAQLKGDYLALWNTSHTGLLLGRRYPEAVEKIIRWLIKY